MQRSLLAYGAACLLALTGCGSQDDYQDYSNAEKTPDAHAHPEHGPNGGHLIELGKHEYHAEVVMDAKTRAISIYMFGHDLDEKLPIPAEEIVLELEDGEEEIMLTLVPDPLEGETEGASRFTVKGDEVPESLDDIEKLHGHFHVDIKDKEYVGELAHEH